MEIPFVYERIFIFFKITISIGTAYSNLYFKFFQINRKLVDSWKVCLASWKVQSWTFQLARQLVRTKRLITASGFEQKLFKSTSRKYRSNIKDTHTNNNKWTYSSHFVARRIQFGNSYGAPRKETGRCFLPLPAMVLGPWSSGFALLALQSTWHQRHRAE